MKFKQKRNLSQIIHYRKNNERYLLISEYQSFWVEKVLPRNKRSPSESLPSPIKMALR